VILKHVIKYETGEDTGPQRIELYKIIYWNLF